MDSLQPHQRTANCNAGHSHVDVEPLSVRSESEAIAAVTGLDRAAGVSTRSEGDVLNDEEAEFILVDGELLAVAPERPAALQDLEERLQQARIDQQVCQPSRVRRGVRKISKLFSRGRNKRASSREAEAALPGGAEEGHGPGHASPKLPQQLQQQQQLQPQQLQQQQLQPLQLQQLQQLPHHPSQAQPPSSASQRRPSQRKQPNQSKRRSWRRPDNNNNNQSPLMQDEDLEVPPLQPPFFPPPLVPPASLPPIAPPRSQLGAAHDSGGGSGGGRAHSVTASFVGTADQLLEAGVWPAAETIEYKIEDDSYDEYAKKEDDHMPSLVPKDADDKVDKADAPDVESMLLRAAQETVTDLEHSESFPQWTDRKKRFKSSASGSSWVTLSQAEATDERVHNDMLKIVVVSAPTVDKSWVARGLRQTNKRRKKRDTLTLGVEVHSWSPSGDCKCSLWDVQGATLTGDTKSKANFGAHPGTQSLFFSDQSLYILVWDLACHNPKTHRGKASKSQRGEDEEFSEEEDDDDDDDDSYGDDPDHFVVEEGNRAADRALNADIKCRVLSWVDCIAQRCPKSAILPVALIPAGMAKQEIQRRCDMMQYMLEEHFERFPRGDESAPKLIVTDNILCVNYPDGTGMEQLQRTVLAVATDSKRSVFEHVGTPVPVGTVLVMEATRRFAMDHKLILLDHLLGELGELGSALSVDEVIGALHFLSSVGELLYYGTAGDEVLSQYIILSRKWLVSALSCILRNDLKRELTETRRFMNMQCIYSEQKFVESEVTQALLSSDTSSCPLLSDEDAKMLWQSMSFMREAADRHSQLAETSTSTPTMFYFLERLLVHAGIFLPLGIGCSSLALEASPEVFFVPSLLAPGDPRDVWTYRTADSWMTTICHSWLFRDGAPSNLMERMSVMLLRDLYDTSRSFAGAPQAEHPHRTTTDPLSRTSMNLFLEDHSRQAVGRIRIHQVVCWKSSMLVKIGTLFADPESGDLRESFVEVFLAIVDQSNSHCVSADAMRDGMQRVVVSAKGQIGHSGRKLWKGGYKAILDSLRETLSGCTNVDSQVVCPECLAHSDPRTASTWSWDSILAVAESGSAVVRCLRGHRVDNNLICGFSTNAGPKAAPNLDPSAAGRGKSVVDLLPGVVLVGLWDARKGDITHIGSGFVVDKKLGLVVTAGHVLFNMTEGTNFGARYFGLTHAKVVIGVIPEKGRSAVYRYFAEIVADDIHNVDACVLKITTRLANDVDGEASGCADEPKVVLGPEAIPHEKLKALKLTSRFELEESVRIMGFNQGGDGLHEPGEHINRAADFAKGYICRLFKASASDDSSSSDSSSHMSFAPREEIVIMCPNIAGHSGGPCVNDEGKVIGIVSRADPVDRQRCYLVPSTEVKTLVNQAKKHCTRPGHLVSAQSI